MIQLLFNTLPVDILTENGKVELQSKEYMHWKPADWVYSHGMAKYFHMDSRGTLTINDHGLFLIYAQVIISFCTFLLSFYLIMQSPL